MDNIGLYAPEQSSPSGPFQNHFRTISEPLQIHFRTISDPLQNHFRSDYLKAHFRSDYLKTLFRLFSGRKAYRLNAYHFSKYNTSPKTETKARAIK